MSRIHVRPKKQRSSDFNLHAVRAVLDAFGHASVWSGATSDLTVVRIDRTKPLSLANAMVLQVREASRKVPADVIDNARKIAANCKPARSSHTN